MPYEFLAKNGLISQGNITATGSLAVTQNISAIRTGSFGAVAIGTNNLQDSLTIGSSISESLLIQNNTYNNLSNGTQITTHLGFLNAVSPNLNFARWTGGSNTDFAGVGMSSGPASYDLQFVSGRQNTGSAINYFTASAVRMTIKAVTGNIGIGTTNPGGKLEIRANDASNYIFSGTSTSGYTTTFTMDDTALYVGHDSSVRSLTLRTNSTSRLTITGGGNVGIGTTSPLTNLHITNVSANPLAAAIGGDSKLVISGVDGTIDLLSQDDNSTVSNVIGMGRYNSSTGALIHKFGIVTWANTGAAGSNTGDRFGFHYGTNADSYASTELLTIKSGGNVGIGSTNPSYKLDVVGPSTALASQPGIVGRFTQDVDGRTLIRVVNSSISSGAAALQSGISFVAYSTSSNQPSTNTHEAQIILGSTGATSVSGGQTGTLQIVAPLDIAFNVSASNTIMTGSSYTTFGSNAMYLARSGNVGIGSTGPGAKLDVVGDLRVKSGGAAIILDTNAATDGRMEYKYNGTRKALIGVDSDNLQISADSGNYLQFRTNNTQRMIINNSGGVGIGTSSPLYLFDLYDTGTNSAMMSLRSSGSGNARIYFDAANGDLVGSDYCYVGQDDSTLNFVINTANVAGDIHLQPKWNTSNGKLIVSGSSQFGLSPSSTHQFTGSVIGNFTSSRSVGVGFLGTASWAATATTLSSSNISQFTNDSLYQYHRTDITSLSSSATLNQPLSTFDNFNITNAPTSGWYNGWISTHNSYLHSIILNLHRTSTWQVGYMEEGATNPTWYTLLHSGNYNSYSPTLTGTGASGTWSITSSMANALNSANSYTVGSLTSTVQASGATGTLVSYVTPGIYANGSSTGNGIGLISNTSFANQGAIANIGLHQVSASVNDITAGVYMSIGGWHQASATGLPVYIGGGYISNSSSILSVVPTNTAGAGNVGIGTRLPGYKLDVNGDIRAMSGSTIRLQTSAGQERGTFQATDTTGAGGAGLAIATSGGEEIAFKDSTDVNMVIKGTGRVGIGTITPAEMLHISSSNNTQLRLESANDTAVQFVSPDTHSYALGLDLSDSSKFKISYNASRTPPVLGTNDRLVIDTNGNVGVNTATPGAKLEVYGGLLSSPSGSTVTIANFASILSNASYLKIVEKRFATGGDWTTATTRIQKTVDVTDQAYIDFNPSGSAYGIAFGTGATNPTQKMVIDINGNVGIGTTSPTAQLHICLDTVTFPAKNVARIVNLGYSGITGAQNWTLRGAFQYSGGIAVNADGGDLDLIKSLDRNTILATKTDGTQLGNVGIGTTAPAFLLDVSGSSRHGFTSSNTHQFTGSVSLNGSLSTNANISASGTGSFGAVGIGTTSVGQDKLTILNSISATDYTGSTFTGGTAYFDNKGGISIYNPNSTTNNFSALDFYTDQTNYSNVGAARIVCKHGARSTGGTFDTSLIFLTHNQGGTWNQTIIDNSGNVGIGTISPSQLVDAYKSVNSDVVYQVTNPNVGTNATAQFFASNGTTKSQFFHTGTSYSGTGVVNYTGLGGIYNTSTGISLAAAGSSGFIAFGTGTNQPERMRITSAGNVGIGTTAPAVPLDVLGNTATVIIRTSTSISSSYSGLRIYNDQNNLFRALEIDYAGSAYASSLITGAPTGEAATIATTGAYPLVLGTSNTARLTITSGGDVGINTITPGARLDVNGAIRVGASSANTHVFTGSLSIAPTGSAINFSTAGLPTTTVAKIFVGTAPSPAGSLTTPLVSGYGADDYGLILQAGYAGDMGGIKITDDGVVIWGAADEDLFRVVDEDANTLRFAIDGTGNVGINTNTPDVFARSYGTILGITGSSTAIELNSANGTYVDLGVNGTRIGGLFASSTSYEIGTPGNIPIYFYTNGLTKMTVLANGNVGIGTSNPAAKLSVTGSGTGQLLAGDAGFGSGNYTGISVNGTLNTSAYNILSSPTDTNLYINRPSGNNIYFRENNQDQMVLLTGGNLGIGTSSPSAKVQISGSANSVLLNVKSPISGNIVYVTGSGAVGINTTTPAYTLQVNGSFAATTKSFVIDHPTKPDKKLVYGSLESPYHGIRLTGRDTLVDGKCVVELPDYISKLIMPETVNIQLTGIKCNKTLYVDDINIKENNFTVAYDKGVFESYKDYDFFWDFTAVRSDVPELQTEM